MNKRILKIFNEAGFHQPEMERLGIDDKFEKFAELIVKETLDEVAERAYYTGDGAWSDELDRPWIELEFGYGPLHDAKTFRS
jgi:hypothetical protein